MLAEKSLAEASRDTVDPGDRRAGFGAGMFAGLGIATIALGAVSLVMPDPFGRYALDLERSGMTLSVMPTGNGVGVGGTF